ncbi:MAG TPA: FkbM family methyltransferase [Mucilaginibacter sp.]|jgi:FkbM family methyltransferase
MAKPLSKIIHKIRQLISDKDYYSLAYSQEGEDLILRRYFNNKLSGFYVDVGAHHPKKYSNTYLFYLRGWRGINIDASPGSMKAFNTSRKRDINLEIGISNTGKELTYYMFNTPAVNSFSKELSEERDAGDFYKIKEKVIIKTERLSSILEKYLPQEVKTIDFMTVDVEGYDLEVLKSNDWKRFRPKFLCVELLNFELFEKDPIFLFLITNGYKFEAKSRQSFIFFDTTN